MQGLWRKRKQGSRRRRAGETLTETLISLLIASFAMLILPGAIVASARLDKAVEEQTLLLEDYTASDPAATLPTKTGVTVTVEDTALPGKRATYQTDAAATAANKITVTYYGTDEEGLYQYEMGTGATP